MFNQYSHTLISNPLVIPIEIGLLAVFLLHIYKTVTMWLRNRAARPVGYRKKEPGRAHQPQEPGVDHDDLDRAVHRWSSSSSTCKQFKFGAWYQVGDTPVRDLYRTEVEVFQNPALGGRLRRLHGARRPAPAPRDLQRVPVARHRSPGLHAAAHRCSASCSRSLIGVGFAVIPVWVYFRV